MVLHIASFSEEENVIENFRTAVCKENFVFEEALIYVKKNHSGGKYDLLIGNSTLWAMPLISQARRVLTKRKSKILNDIWTVLCCKKSPSCRL